MAIKKRHAKSPVTLLLEKQHELVKAIFKKLETGRSAPEPLLEQLSNNLAAHMAIEQEIYYPAVKDVKEDLVLESYEEHALVEFGLKRLLGTSSDDESFEAKVTACKELIEHHIEEEESELFPAVDGELDPELLAAMAKDMKARFAEVLAEGFAAATPKGFRKTSADVARKVHAAIPAH